MPLEEDPIKLWQHLHGATVHFSLALTVVSALFDFGSLLSGKKEWRTVGFWTLFMATALSVPAALSGLWGQLGWFKAEAWTADHLLQHRLVGLIGTGILLALLCWRVFTGDFGLSQRSDFQRDRKAGRIYAIYVLLVLLVAGVVGYTAFLGAYVARGY